MDIVPFVSAVGLGIALAAIAGLRAWMPLLLAGILSRADVFQLGSSFSFLSSTPALIAFGIATAIEILGDKIPTVDHALDAIGTVLRPAAGALLASAAIGAVTDPLVATALGAAVGIPSAIVPHAAKATLRAASTVLTAGLANPILSTLEDLLALALIVLAALLPAAVVLLLAVTALLLLRRLVRHRPVRVTA
jgi:hypothetical protein